MEGKWDLIVLGAGIGGLACAALLVSAGKMRIGGRVTRFPITDIPAEFGFHGLSAGGHTIKALEKVGHPVPMVKLEPNFVIYRDKRFFEVPGRLEDFAKFEYIPQCDRAELVELLRFIAGTNIDESEEYDFVGWGDFLKEHTTSQAIYDFMSLFGNVPITGEFNSNIAAGEALRCLSLVLREGGWSVFSKDAPLNVINAAFASSVKESGGPVLTNTHVHEVIVRDYDVKGVTTETSDGLLKLEAPVVICNIQIWDIFRLVAQENFPRWFIDSVYFLEEHSQIAPRSAIGITCVSSQPLHPYKTAVLAPCDEKVNSTGPSYVRWLGESGNWLPKIAPKGNHLFQYGSLIPRWYLDLLREKPSILAKEVNGLWNEIFAMFPDFNQENIIWKEYGIIPSTDSSMKFPGNSWKHRGDVKAPNVTGLYLVGDTVCGWGVAMDGVVCLGILCAERILKTKLVEI